MSFFIGLGLVFLFGTKKILTREKKEKIFQCGHCESNDTLQMMKLREREVFTCSFCDRMIDEDLLRIQYRKDYELIKTNYEQYKTLKEARKDGR